MLPSEITIMVCSLWSYVDIQIMWSTKCYSVWCVLFSFCIRAIHGYSHYIFCILLHFKCCGSHTNGTSYLYFCINIADIQGFNLVVTEFCVSLCDGNACVNLDYSHCTRRTCKQWTLFYFAHKPILKMQKSNKHAYSLKIRTENLIYDKRIQGKILVTRITVTRITICPTKNIVF